MEWSFREDFSEPTMSDLSLRTWQARPLPERRVLEGRYCRLEPFEAERHGEELFAASTAPGMEPRVRYLTDAPKDRHQFVTWMARERKRDDAMFFAVVDNSTHRCEGRQAFMRMKPEHGVIEIGAILWGDAIARTRVATEAFYLFAHLIFDQLGYRRFEWKCDSRNEPSRRSAERFGFQFEGVFRQHMVVHGENRDSTWYGMTDSDWKRLHPAFQRWLAPSNFDAQGKQVQSLKALQRASA